MKSGRGIKDLDDKSRGMEILMTEAFTRIKPTDPLILGRHTSRRKRKWSDSSGMSLDKADLALSRWSGQVDQGKVGDNDFNVCLFATGLKKDEDREQTMSR